MFDKHHETLSREELAQLQIERLQTTLNRVYRNVSFYRALFDREKIEIERLRRIDDLRHLPFTTKDDLRTAYPYGMFAVPLRDIVRIHATSGTTGKPVVVGYTRNDVRRWSELIARQLDSLGITDHDVIQIAFDYSLFTGGLGFHYGAELLGASVIPASSGRNVREQITIMKDYKATALITTPTHALSIASTLDEMGLHPEDLHTKTGVFGAEPWSENMRKEIEAKYGIDAYDIYGLTEITGPGVAFECEAKDGLHINEDFFYPEIIDPVTGKVLPDGEKGELVFTTLVKEGTPLIRYRTRDVTFLRRDICSCGRTTVKMNRLFGRTDDMLIIRGVNVFPSQIEHALIEIEGTDPHYLIIVDRGPSHLDEVELQVEVKKELFGDETKSLEALRARIENVMKSKLGIALKVKLVEPKTIERSIGKAKRVIDRRTL